MSGAWTGRRVLVTGHTGFKGSWLSLWLNAMGAEVTGFALAPPTEPSLFEAARIAGLVRHIIENSMLNGEVIRLDGALRMAAK